MINDNEVATPGDAGKSQTSKKVTATLSLREMSLRMVDTTTELLAIHRVMKDMDYFERDKKQTLRTIKSRIIPYLNACLKTLIKSTNLLAPIAGTNYINNVNKRERKQKVLGDITNIRKNKKLPNLQMLEDSSGVKLSAGPP